MAVDGPKSADRPDDKVLSANNLLIGYRDIGWLKEYKDKDTYKNKVLLSNSNSPVDLMVQPVNEVWSDNQIEKRQTHQFEKLFNNLEITPEDIKWAEEVRGEYNKLNAYAFHLKKEYDEAPGPRLKLTTEAGEELEIINTFDSNHPLTYGLNNAKIYFRENDKKLHPELNYVAFAEVPGETNKNGKPLFKRIGFLSKTSEQKHRDLIKLAPNKAISDIINGTVTISAGVTPNQIQAAFKKASEFCEKTYEAITDPTEKQGKAAALWKVSHRRQIRERNEQGEWDDSQRFNKANAVFAIFGDEINQQLDNLQFNQIKVAGVDSAYSQTGALPQSAVVPITIKVEDNERSPQFGKRAIFLRGQQNDGQIVHKRIGYIPSDEPQLPILSFATATINREGDIEKTATATLENGQVIKIGELANFDYPTTTFDNTTATLEITSAIPKGKKKAVPAVKLNGKLLGVIKDKNHQKILQQQNSTAGKSFTTHLNRGYYNSTVTLNIAPQTITYPDRHLGGKAVLQGEKTMDEPQKPFWTIQGDTAKIVVDYRRQKFFEEAFKQKMNIDYQLINTHQEDVREYDLGLVIFEVNKNKLSNWNVTNKWGEALSTEEYEAKLNEIAQKPLLKEKNIDNGQKVQGTTVDLNVDNNNTQSIISPTNSYNKTDNHSLTDNNSGYNSSETEYSQTTSSQKGLSKQDIFDSLSTYLSPEFMPENIAIQQQRTEQVAPVLLALLQAKKLTEPDNFDWDEKTNTLSYKGKQDTISWNGQQISLTNHDGEIKMIAQVNRIDNKTQYSALHLPLNSPGLSQQDVEFFTQHALVNSLKNTLVKNSPNTAVSIS